MGFYVDGQSYPSQPLQPTYKADQYVDCYRTLTLFRNDINVYWYDYKESKKISNDQELTQSDPTSCPQNQKGNN